MNRLTSEQIRDSLTNSPNWELVDGKIVGEYRFEKYLNGIKFVDKVAQDAENKQHHPLISINYKKVNVTYYSWQEKGLTELDFEMAKRVDEVYEVVDK